jgi:hypothetical protein
MLKDLKKEVIKTRLFNLKVCPECWDPDHPQLQLGMYPVDDPQAVREPRPDVSYTQSGTSGLQILLTNSTAPDGFGFPNQGSRDIQWSRGFDDLLTPNNLVLNAEIGTVTILTT